MKMKKFMASVLAVSMMAAFAGCAKVKSITADDFKNACEELGAVEVDPEDADTDEDDLEDGLYTVMDSDYIEENLSNNEVTSDLSMYGISTPDIDEIIDPEDIEEMVVYARLEENTDDISDPEDIADLSINCVIAAQVTLNNSDSAADIMEGLADGLDEFGIDVEDLSSNEYYTGKNEGFLKINVSVEDLVAAFIESDIYDILSSFSDDFDVEEMTEDMTGSASLAFYVKGENVVIVINCNVNEDASFCNDFCSELGVDDPSKLPSNTMVAESICDYIDDTFGSMISGFAAMASYDY